MGESPSRCLVAADRKMVEEISPQLGASCCKAGAFHKSGRLQISRTPVSKLHPTSWESAEASDAVRKRRIFCFSFEAGASLENCQQASFLSKDWACSTSSQTPAICMVMYRPTCPTSLLRYLILQLCIGICDHNIGNF